MTAVRLVALVLCAATLEAADTPRAVEVSAMARDGRVYVSCAIAPGRLEGLGDPIRAGLTTSITYDVDLRRPMWWFERTVASAAVVASVQLDTLTGRYHLTRTVDGRNEATLVTDDGETVKKFLGVFSRLPLFSTADLEANVEYAVRLKARMRPRVAWSIWPGDSGSASGTARFTFIP